MADDRTKYDDLPYLEGWQKAADWIGMSLSSLLEHRKALKDRGIAFRYLKGRPPDRRVVIRVWKNLFQGWYMENKQK